MGNIQQGLENLKRHIKIAPEAPGVYRMLGENDEVLYVGKAKNIKKRIVAYSHFDTHGFANQADGIYHRGK